MRFTELLSFLILVLYNVAILGFCSYIVFWRGHSGWWFLLAIILLGQFKKNDKLELDS